MQREEKKTTAGRIETEALSQGLVEQAYVQAQSVNQDLEEVGTAYLDLNTGACATNPGLCAEHPHQETGKLQEKARKASDTYVDTMRRWTASFRNYNMDDLTHQVQLFARQHPALVIGGAVLAGFALTRAIKITGNGKKTERGYGREPSFEPGPGRDMLPGEEEVFHS